MDRPLKCLDPPASRTLSDELRGIREELDTAVGPPFLVLLTSDVHPTPLVVFTGQFSSGRSTFIKALTNGRANPVMAVIGRRSRRSR
jgi:hypothetical protein